MWSPVSTRAARRLPCSCLALRRRFRRAEVWAEDAFRGTGGRAGDSSRDGGGAPRTRPLAEEAGGTPGPARPICLRPESSPADPGVPASLGRWPRGWQLQLRHPALPPGPRLAPSPVAFIDCRPPAHVVRGLDKRPGELHASTAVLQAGHRRGIGRVGQQEPVSELNSPRARSELFACRTP